MKQTLILTILIGILLFAAMALAGENCLAGDTVRVAAVTLHTNDARLAYLLNGGDGYAMFKEADILSSTMLPDNEVVMKFIE